MKTTSKSADLKMSILAGHASSSWLSGNVSGISYKRDQIYICGGLNWEHYTCFLFYSFTVFLRCVSLVDWYYCITVVLF